MSEVRDRWSVFDAEALAEIRAEREAELVAGLAPAEEGIARLASVIGPGAAGDLALGDGAADIVLRALGGQRDLGSFEDPPAFVLAPVQPGEPPVEGDEAGVCG